MEILIILGVIISIILVASIKIVKQEELYLIERKRNVTGTKSN